MNTEDTLGAVADEQFAQRLECGVGDLRLLFRMEEAIMSKMVGVIETLYCKSGRDYIHSP